MTQVLLVSLFLFGFWTLTHQVATFSDINWSLLSSVFSWATPVLTVIAWLLAKRIRESYVEQIPSKLYLAGLLDGRVVVPLGAAFLACASFLEDYSLRFVLFMILLGGTVIHCKYSVRREVLLTACEPLTQFDGWRAYVFLMLVTLVPVSVVVLASRSDFDDAEYIQTAIQTLRYPEHGVFTFDASLGILLDQFRFAPYRVVSYESLVALISQWSGLEVLDIYYLLLPVLSAVLSVLAGFIFLRWFLPLRWSLAAVLVFVLIALAWGETHIAYGNRMFVRLFQGKGLLVAITTPCTIVLALLWMRRPAVHTWLGLLMCQVAAVGVSSTGLVITLFATVVGLLAGALSQASWRSLQRLFIGAFTLVYPISLGLWIKFGSSASGKIEAIGTYLPINASFGGLGREALALTVLLVSAMLAARSTYASNGVDASAASNQSQRNLLWLIVVSAVVVLNPVFTELFTALTAKNMNWRLAWSTPIPLMTALGLVYLLCWASVLAAPRWRRTATLLPGCLAVAFAVIGQWSVSQSNGVRWGGDLYKVPPEYWQAIELAEEIRSKARGQDRITVLVEPRVGTWLTVVAPEFGIVMPGHGYIMTLETIMERDDFTNRIRLLNNVERIAAGEVDEFETLLNRYGVNVIVSAQSGDRGFRVLLRSLESV